MFEPSDTPASTDSGTGKMATAGKRGHTTTPGNPVFTTPAKPQSKGIREMMQSPKMKYLPNFSNLKLISISKPKHNH